VLGYSADREVGEVCQFSQSTKYLLPVTVRHLRTEENRRIAIKLKLKGEVYSICGMDLSGKEYGAVEDCCQHCDEQKLTTTNISVRTYDKHLHKGAMHHVPHKLTSYLGS
jgi:hypothetical protein